MMPRTFLTWFVAIALILALDYTMLCAWTGKRLWYNSRPADVVDVVSGRRWRETEGC